MRALLLALLLASSAGASDMNQPGTGPGTAVVTSTLTISGAGTACFTAGALSINCASGSVTGSSATFNDLRLTYGLTAATGSFSGSLTASSMTSLGDTWIKGNASVGQAPGTYGAFEVRKAFAGVGGNVSGHFSDAVNSSFNIRHMTGRVDLSADTSVLSLSAVSATPFYMNATTLGFSGNVTASSGTILGGLSVGNLLTASSATYSAEKNVAAYANPGVDQNLTSFGDSTTQAAGVGGGILFRGAYTGTSQTDAGAIQAQKSNSTAGNYSFDMTFHTRVNGGANAERMRITDGGSVGIGTASPCSTCTLHVAGGVSVTGGLGFGTRTKAQFDAATGVPQQAWLCSDCAIPYSLCVGTGTTLSGWKVSHSATIGCGTNN